jgi:hypothetical protein
VNLPNDQEGKTLMCRIWNVWFSSGMLCALVGAMVLSCDSTGTDEAQAVVRIKNDFNNPDLDRKPPWTICECSYRDVEFGKVLMGDTSAAREVEPGLDYVLMVLAWNDTACSTRNCLPVASRNEEEVVGGQVRTIAINAPNHQGPCPPEGIEPIPTELYERIRALWPEYGFLPDSLKTQNPECLD